MTEKRKDLYGDMPDRHIPAEQNDNDTVRFYPDPDGGQFVIHDTETEDGWIKSDHTVEIER